MTSRDEPHELQQIRLESELEEARGEIVALKLLIVFLMVALAEGAFVGPEVDLRPRLEATLRSWLESSRSTR